MKEKTKEKIELTDTSLFLLPCFGRTYKEYKELGFVNCFLSDKNRDKVNEKDIHLYLLFRPDPKQSIRLNTIIEKFEDEDKEHLVYLDDYDYDGGYTVLVFKFPERFRNDYELFIKGKYSKFSPDFKDTIPERKIAEFVNEFNKPEKLAGKTTQWMIINKDPRIKRYVEEKYGIDLDGANEYWHLPIMEKEILNIDKINEL